MSAVEDREDNRVAAGLSTTILVCVTCRRAGDCPDAPRPGASLARATAAAALAEAGAVRVRRVRCLANCQRGLSAAIRRDGAWTYVFGDLTEDHGAEALVAGARLLASAADGIMPWRGRPDALKRGMVARVPPADHEDPE